MRIFSFQTLLDITEKYIIERVKKCQVSIKIIYSDTHLQGNISKKIILEIFKLLTFKP